MMAAGGRHLEAVAAELLAGDVGEVKAGLRNGERVVMSPPQGLADGVKIQIK